MEVPGDGVGCSASLGVTVLGTGQGSGSGRWGCRLKPPHVGLVVLERLGGGRRAEAQRLPFWPISSALLSPGRDVRAGTRAQRRSRRSLLRLIDAVRRLGARPLCHDLAQFVASHQAAWTPKILSTHPMRPQLFGP